MLVVEMILEVTPLFIAPVTDEDRHRTLFVDVGHGWELRLRSKAFDYVEDTLHVPSRRSSDDYSRSSIVAVDDEIEGTRQQSIAVGCSVPADVREELRCV